LNGFKPFLYHFKILIFLRDGNGYFLFDGVCNFLEFVKKEIIEHGSQNLEIDSVAGDAWEDFEF
jgi:hypothetical protein